MLVPKGVMVTMVSIKLILIIIHTYSFVELTAKFIVHANPYGVVCLQNKKSPHYWLAINNGIRGNVG